MGKPYSEDLRNRVVGATQDGGTIPEIAEQLGVSISSVVRFRRLQREMGSVSSAKFGGYKEHALAAHEELVKAIGGGAAGHHASRAQGRFGEEEGDGRSIVDLPISASFDVTL